MSKVKSWKPAHIKKLISLGDKRSYNEISADLELEIWTERHHGEGSVSSNERSILGLFKTLVKEKQ
jgi:hypothetical protein